MSQIDATTGSLLEMLARAVNASRVLEIGTRSGESALCIARALADGGLIITLERDETRARRARAACAAAGLSARVSVMIGDAARYLHKISGPFDLVVVHVDATQHATLRPHLMRLLRHGGLLAAAHDAAEGEISLSVKR